jgi:hypothetical protein
MKRHARARTRRSVEGELQETINNAIAGRTRVETSALAIAAAVVIAIQRTLAPIIPDEEIRRMNVEILSLVYRTVAHRIETGIKRRRYH